jgi:TonB family protein
MIPALLADAAIRAALLGAVTWTALQLFRVRNPHVHKLVWRAVLVAGLALPAVLYFRLAQRFAIELPIPLLASATPDAKDGTASATPGAILPWRAISFIYFGVAAALLARFLIGVIGMWRLCRTAEPLALDFDVRISARVLSPATFGSVVLLPVTARKWSVAERDTVLSHEHAHVRGRDCHWLWLAQLQVIVFWFSPFAWWLRRRLAALAETTSDEAVLAANHDPLAYAQLLVDFARSPDSRRVVMSVSDSDVSTRIERILSRKPPAVPPRRILRWVALALSIPATVFAAATAGAPVVPADYRALDNSNPAAPRIIDFGDLASLDERYPPLAKEMRVTGDVMLGATIDAEGRVIEVIVLDEQPADPQYGFGAVALDIARTVRFANPGKVTAYVKFRVKFKLAS